MATVLRIHLAGLLLLSYAALFNGVSVQKLTVNSSKVTLKTKSSTVPELSLLNGANGVGVMYSRGAESARRHRNTLKLHNILRWDVDPPAANMPKLVSNYGPFKTMASGLFIGSVCTFRSHYFIKSLFYNDGACSTRAQTPVVSKMVKSVFYGALALG